LVAQGWAVLAVDLPGHGRSPGRRGCAPSYDGILKTLAEARRVLASRLGPRPQFIIGHSMGGNLAINFALRRSEFETGVARRMDGLVLMAPMLRPPAPLDRQRIMAAWGTGYLLRWVRISKPVCVDQLTRDQRIAARIESDPLRHHQISLYLATQLLAQGRFALDHAARIQTPSLVVFGDEDNLIDRAACRNLVIRMRGRGKLITWPGGRHDLVSDRDADQVIEHITDWFAQTTSPERAPATKSQCLAA
jgi:alpha-beta hydrolase superfamily lysophospholipase